MVCPLLCYFNFADSDNSATRADLQRVDDLLQNDIFLKALGEKSASVQQPSDFPVVTDIVRAHTMMTSQEIWDMPEPWPYQYFVGVIGNGVQRYRHLTHEEVSNIRNKFLNTKAFGRMSNYVDERIDKAYRRHSVGAFLRSTLHSNAVNEKEIDFILNNSFRNEINAYLLYLIKAAYYGGIDNSPVFKRVYEAFLTGGIPCGWIGPLPENGGDPEECMQLLHFGKKGPEKS